MSGKSYPVREHGMKLYRCFLLFFVFGIAMLAQAKEEVWYQKDFPPEEFKARWAAVFENIGKDAVAVVQGLPQTNGFIYPRQSNEFYYLSGIETPGSYILLDGRSHKVTLFLPPRNARLESAEGKVLSAEDADLVKTLTGVDDVLSTEAMRQDWLGSVPGPRGGPHVIYTPFTPAEGAQQSRYEVMGSNAAIASDYWDGRVSREAHLVGLLHTRYPSNDVRDLSPILDSLRSVKSEREIALLRRAGQLAGLGILEAIKSTRPGVYEYQLDAAARYIHLVNGARLEGYRSIVASGTETIWNMHYYRDSGQLVSGDMLLLDYAPDYHYYVSDITRMWPVNGKFSPVQREMLGFVLAYRTAIMQRIRPGVTATQIMEEAKAAMEPVFAQTKFSKPIYEQAAHKFVDTGGGVFSHPVGMAVHDDGGYFDRPLKPGEVFSIDPQLRVPEEDFYYRYEDVIVITPTGYENFTDFMPTKLDDIEKLVGQGGVLQKVPPSGELPK
jgi:Xaa-Pro aminopeptidase